MLRIFISVAGNCQGHVVYKYQCSCFSAIRWPIFEPDTNFWKFRLCRFCTSSQICQIMLGSSMSLEETLVIKFYTLTKNWFFSVIELDVQISTLPQWSALKTELIYKFCLFMWNGSSNWLTELLLSVLRGRYSKTIVRTILESVWKKSKFAPWESSGSIEQDMPTQ